MVAQSIPCPDDNAASLLPIRPPITDVGGDDAMQEARRLFETCRDSHELCPRQKTPLLPTRVIDVGADADGIRIHSARPGEHQDYAALSYCWGDRSQFC